MPVPFSPARVTRYGAAAITPYLLTEHNFGLRAEMPPYGAQELLELELYLAWRGSGLPIETPGVRR